MCCCIIVVTSCTERERERESVRERSLPPPCNRRRVCVGEEEENKRLLPLCFLCHCIPLFHSVFYSSWAVVVFPTLWVFHVISCVRHCSLFCAIFDLQYTSIYSVVAERLVNPFPNKVVSERGLEEEMDDSLGGMFKLTGSN